ncbi:MAG: hypothetical protein JWO25_2478 [Alphaproteobacteria bacterium]|nr:hypothetical protein [Alphaproteobacteria bacterium]
MSGAYRFFWTPVRGCNRPVAKLGKDKGERGPMLPVRAALAYARRQDAGGAAWMEG